MEAVSFTAPAGRRSRQLGELTSGGATHTLGLDFALRLDPGHCRLRRLGFSHSRLSRRGSRPPAVRTRTGLVVVLAVLGRAPPPSPPVRHLRSGMVGTGRSQGIVGSIFLLRLLLLSNGS